MNPSALNRTEVTEALFQKRNIEPLERIAQRIVREPYTLPAIDRERDYPLLQDERGLERWATDTFESEIRPAVNAFLSIDNAQSTPIDVRPEVKQSSYDRSRQRIIIGADVIAKARTENGFAFIKSVLAHEYAHAVVDQMLRFPTEDPFGIEYNMFFEGHANGPEFHAVDLPSIAQVPALHVKQQQMDLLLLDVYAGIAYRNGLDIPQEVKDRQSALYLARGRLGRSYAFGHSLFSIAAQKHGPGIYAEALRNPRAVLE